MYLPFEKKSTSTTPTKVQYASNTTLGLSTYERGLLSKVHNNKYSLSHNCVQRYQGTLSHKFCEMSNFFINLLYYELNYTPRIPK